MTRRLQLIAYSSTNMVETKPATKRRGRPTGSKKLVVKHVAVRPKANDSKLEKTKYLIPGKIVFEKRKVLEVLRDRHTKTHFHCRMEGGITQHVPKHLF